MQYSPVDKPKTCRSFIVPQRVKTIQGLCPTPLGFGEYFVDIVAGQFCSLVPEDTLDKEGSQTISRWVQVTGPYHRHTVAVLT